MWAPPLPGLCGEVAITPSWFFASRRPRSESHLWGRGRAAAVCQIGGGNVPACLEGRPPHKPLFPASPLRTPKTDNTNSFLSPYTNRSAGQGVAVRPRLERPVQLARQREEKKREGGAFLNHSRRVSLFFLSLSPSLSLSLSLSLSFARVEGGGAISPLPPGASAPPQSVWGSQVRKHSNGKPGAQRKKSLHMQH